MVRAFQPVVQRIEQLEVERVAEILDDDADPSGAPRREAAAALAWDVAERLGGVENALSCRLGDARVAAQRP